MLEETIETLKIKILELSKSLWEGYAPVHKILSTPIWGPFTYYFVVIIVIQILLNFIPSGGKHPRITASHILVKDREKAIELKDMIEKDPSQFSTIAKEHSTCPSGKNGGGLGAFGKGQMVAEFDQVCFDPSVETGRVYGPIKTQFGYHLIKVTSRPISKEKKE